LPLSQMGKKLGRALANQTPAFLKSGVTSGAKALANASDEVLPQVGGWRRQLHGIVGKGGPSKYLTPDENTLRGHTSELLKNPLKKLRSEAAGASSLEKGMIAGSAGMEAPGMFTGTAEERAGAAGKVLGGTVTGLAFRRAPLMGDLVSGFAGEGIGGALGRSLARGFGG